MRKLILALLAIALIFSVLGVAANVAYADDPEDEPVRIFPVSSDKWLAPFPVDELPSLQSAAFCGSSCG